MEFDPAALVALASIPSTTLLGCVAAYVYSDQKGINSSTAFLGRMFPDKSDAFYFRFDFVLSAFVGTCIAVILYSPTTSYQALAAGIGWTAAFNLLKTPAQQKAENLRRKVNGPPAGGPGRKGAEESQRAHLPTQGDADGGLP